MYHKLDERRELLEKAVSLNIVHTLKDDILNAPDEITKTKLTEFRDNELLLHNEKEDEVYRLVTEVKDENGNTAYQTHYMNFESFTRMIGKDGGFDFLAKEVDKHMNKEFLTLEDAEKIYSFMQDMDWRDYEKEQDIAYLQELTKDDSVEELNSDVLPDNIETIGDLLNYIDKEHEDR